MAVLLIDGNNVGHAALFGSDPLHGPSGEPTNATYTFLRMIKPVLETMLLGGDYLSENVRVVVAWDNQPSWRVDELPTYKESRKKAKDPATEELLKTYPQQMKNLRALLTDLGIGQITAEKQEADDLAGFLVKRGGRYVLFSGDHDWLQLIGPDVKCWHSSKLKYFSLENFTEITEGCIDAEEFVKLKAITGDSGDDVPGIKGVGVKTGLKYLRGELTKGKKFDDIEAWKKDPNGYKLSYRLVDLRDRDIDHTTITIKPGVFDNQGAWDKCGALGFNSFMADWVKWTEPFVMSSQGSK